MGRKFNNIEDKLAYAHGIFDLVVSMLPNIDTSNYTLTVSQSNDYATIENNIDRNFDHFSLTDLSSGRFRIYQFLNDSVAA